MELIIHIIFRIQQLYALILNQRLFIPLICQMGVTLQLATILLQVKAIFNK